MDVFRVLNPDLYSGYKKARRIGRTRRSSAPAAPGAL